MEDRKPTESPAEDWLGALLRRIARQRAHPSVPALQPAPEEAQASWIPEEEVSDVSVAGIVARACMPCESAGDDHLRCRTLGGLRFFVCLRTEARLLQVMATLSLLPPERRDEGPRVALRINDTLLTGRAAIDADGDLVMDASLSFAGGLAPAQLLHTIALLERSCMEARHLADAD